MLTFLVFLVPFINLTIWSLSTLDLLKGGWTKIKKYSTNGGFNDDFPMVESKNTP